MDKKAKHPSGIKVTITERKKHGTGPGIKRKAQEIVEHIPEGADLDIMWYKKNQSYAVYYIFIQICNARDT